ncbi:MAG: hypothetical protein ACRD3W_10080, partial [Terriglobales bacterium]
VQMCGKPVLVISDVRPAAFTPFFEEHSGKSESRTFNESYLGRRYSARSDAAAKLNNELERVSYLYGFRSYLRESLLHWMQMVAQPEVWRRQSLATQESHDGCSMNGWTPRFQVMSETALVPGDPEFERIVNRLESLVGKQPFHWTDRSTEQIRAFCADKHVPLLFVWYPTHPMLKEAWSKAGVDSDEFGSIFRRLCSKNVYFLDMHNADQDIHHFYTRDHLNAYGAIKFSDLFANQLLKPPFVQLIRGRESCLAQSKEVSTE